MMSVEVKANELAREVDECALKLRDLSTQLFAAAKALRTLESAKAAMAQAEDLRRAALEKLSVQD